MKVPDPLGTFLGGKNLPRWQDLTFSLEASESLF